MTMARRARKAASRARMAVRRRGLSVRSSGTCPQCGGTTAMVVGNHRTASGRVDHIRCSRCGHTGDHWKQYGVTFDVPVMVDADGYRHVDDEAYTKRIAEITGENLMRIMEARAEEAEARGPS